MKWYVLLLLIAILFFGCTELYFPSPTISLGEFYKDPKAYIGKNLTVVGRLNHAFPTHKRFDYLIRDEQGYMIFLIPSGEMGERALQTESDYSATGSVGSLEVCYCQTREVCDGKVGEWKTDLINRVGSSHEIPIEDCRKIESAKSLFCKTFVREYDCEPNTIKSVYYINTTSPLQKI